MNSRLLFFGCASLGSRWTKCIAMSVETRKLSVYSAKKRIIKIFMIRSTKLSTTQSLQWAHCDKCLPSYWCNVVLSGYAASSDVITHRQSPIGHQHIKRRSHGQGWPVLPTRRNYNAVAIVSETRSKKEHRFLTEITHTYSYCMQLNGRITRSTMYAIGNVFKWSR